MSASHRPDLEIRVCLWGRVALELDLGSIQGLDAQIAGRVWQERNSEVTKS